jgi:23S rRNA (uracil1939-C5)-methyltransferase
VQRIVETLRRIVGTPAHMIDLYCGAGTFAVLFALWGWHVYGVEENPAAVHEANANAELNGVAERTEFHAGRAERAVGTAQGKAAFAQARAVFLDPPRKGSDDVTLDAIIGSAASDVFYLSCNPATLARDVAYLAAAGFTAQLVQPFDMFPQTGHVEVLMHLRRAL